MKVKVMWHSLLQTHDFADGRKNANASDPRTGSLSSNKQ